MLGYHEILTQFKLLRRFLKPKNSIFKNRENQNPDRNN